jgi:hypothetical protein
VKNRKSHLAEMGLEAGERPALQWSSTEQPIRLVDSFFDICINLFDWLNAAVLLYLKLGPGVAQVLLSILRTGK